MNRLMTKFYAFFRRFRKLLKIIEKQSQMKSVVKSVFGALLLSVLALLLPSLIIINLFIYTKHTFLLSVLMVILVMTWPYIYYFFYYKLLTIYHPKLEEVNTKIVQVTESTFVSLFFLIVGIIVLSIIF